MKTIMLNKRLKDLTDLPPVMEADRLGEDIEQFPNANRSETDDTDGEMHAIPIETDQGRFYILVILKTIIAERSANRSTAFYTFLVLLAQLITVFLVWRFTRPIANLSKAARMVADGDLKVRV